MFTFLAQPIIYLIHFIYSFTDSYAISVILITITVRLILLPLFIKSAKHQKNSKEIMIMIRPKLDELTAKLKKSSDQSEKLKYQKEIQELTADSMKSSLLGCLPIVIQLPILFSLFYAITIDSAIANENLLWMNLGSMDIGISIIAGLIYLIQSFISLDKNQPTNVKVITFINPIVILIFSLFNPSIIPIYWAVSALFLIAQQLLIKTLYK